MPSPPATAASLVHEELCRRYREEYRHFHNLGHIGECIAQLDVVAALLEDRDAVELALWFHDAVYVPGSPENERRSAELFIGHAGASAGLFRRKVCHFILATRHTGKAQGHDAGFIVDIDLAGFAAPWDEFMEKGEALRREYAVQPDPQYYAGQMAFLRRLQQRKAFYRSDYFRRRYEQRAQDNLRRLIALREAQGYAGGG